MANLFRRVFRYSNAYANQKFDEKADPAIQIEQAIEDAKRHNLELTKQAAAVLGNRRQLEMQLARQLDEIESLQGSARQALVLSDQARASGDPAKAAEYERTAQIFAGRLVAGESAVENLKVLHDQALGAADQAKRAVADNEFRLQQSMAEKAKLMTQLQSAKMQERTNEALASMSELAPKGDTPSLSEVRDKIEARYATALGQQELTGGGVEARMMEVRKATIDSAATRRLDAIRASMNTGSSGAQALEKRGPEAIEGGSAGGAQSGVADEVQTGQQAEPPTP